MYKMVDAGLQDRRPEPLQKSASESRTIDSQIPFLLFCLKPTCLFEKAISEYPVQTTPSFRLEVT